MAPGASGANASALGPEDLIVAAPHRQHRHAAVAQPGVQLRVQREVAGVVSEQPQLHRAAAGPVHQDEVVIPGVGELPGGRRAGQAEAQVIRGDHVIPVGQHWDQIAEHERAGRETMQQHHRRYAGRADLSVEQLLAAYVRVPVVDGMHV
jgi:hypothetical protein